MLRGKEIPYHLDGRDNLMEALLAKELASARVTFNTENIWLTFLNRCTTLYRLDLGRARTRVSGHFSGTFSGGVK